MNFYEKRADYLPYFEDALLVDIDHEYNRLAIVFHGKEHLIYLFDLNVYLNYFPYEENATEIEKVKKKLVYAYRLKNQKGLEIRVKKNSQK